MPYQDPERRKAFKHEYYLKHKQEVIDRVKNRCKEHPEDKKRYDRAYNQKKNAPYHEVLDNNKVERVCEFCGSTNNLHTHHKDLNHDNNELSNLQWLCGSCHAKLHAELRRNESTT